MTMSRRRKRENEGLPLFVTVSRNSYIYTHPITRQAHSLGTNRDFAIESAELLNEKIWQNNRGVLKALRHGASSMEKLLDEFTEYRRARTRRDRTWAEIEWKLKLYRTWFQKAPAYISVDDLNERLDLVGDDSVRKHRQLLKELFHYARARAYMAPTAPNPAELVLLRPDKSKRRQRMTIETFWKVYERVSQPCQHAMGIALVTSMREADVLSLTRSAARDGVIRYIPEKTRDNPDPFPTECVLSPESWTRFMAPALESAMALGTQYVIHRDTGRRVDRYWLAHEIGTVMTEVTGLPAGERPTFHEIRSLSANLYARQGESESDVQRRMGHHDERQTQQYLSGHEVVYERVTCDLKL